jgi:hypothetical protein
MVRMYPGGFLVPLTLVAASVSTVAAGGAMAGSFSPFAFFAPSVPIAAADRAKLDAGEAVIKVLPADSRELAVAAAVRVDAPPERLIAWTLRVDAMQKGRYVPAIGRFSDPPRLDDLDRLVLGDGDLEDIRKCRPGDCGLKLSAGEIAGLRSDASAPDWKPELQRGFRQAILARATSYQSHGDAGALPYEDDLPPVAPAEEFAVLVRRLGFLQLQAPPFADYLERYPRLDHPDIVESFLYWSTETLGMKPITSVTHVSIARGSAAGEPAVLVASKQVFASHYRDASLSVTAITGSAGTGRYVVYVHRSRVDVLDGMFGGFIRRAIERRVREEAPGVLLALRRKLEGGEP